MNKFKPLIASLIMLSSMSSLASPNKNQPPAGLAFAGVGIGSNQYLGIYLSTPPAPGNPTKPPIAEAEPTPPTTPPTTPPVCNADVQVLGMDGLPVGDALPTQIISQGATVFLKVGEAGTDSVLAPQYFNVSVKVAPPSNPPTPDPAPSSKNKGKAPDPCTGLAGTLGVYDKVTQDLQVLLPMLPTPAKTGQ